MVRYNFSNNFYAIANRCLAGLAAPYWDSKARGMFIGMTAFSSKGHMLRAAVESMGFRIAGKNSFDVNSRFL